MNETLKEHKKPVLAEALVALASQDGLGEEIIWQDVQAAIVSLLSDPVGPRDIRSIIERLNDPSVASTLQDWFDRAERERSKDAKDASRASEKLLQPIQATSFSVLAASGLAFAIGTLTLPVTAPLMVGGLIVAGVSTFGRWKLSKRSDEAIMDVEAIRGLIRITQV